jgi:YspA, cpYpsA-related SLOG family
MRILLTGDRFWDCRRLAADFLRRLVLRYGTDIVIVQGGAPGVDNAFSTACREAGLTAEVHLADWKGLANVAEPARNREMVESGPDMCIAFHRSITTSKRTKDCVRQALAAAIPV